MSTDKQCDCDACAVVFRLAGPDVATSGDDDILDRLRHQWNGEYDPTGRLLSEAADEIERLRKCESLTRGPLYSLAIEAWEEIERLRALITAWADACVLMEKTGSLDTTTPEGVAAGQALIALRKAVGR